jgi:hypothetical protein
MECRRLRELPQGADHRKLVIQYPPGVGFLLALFPEGYQVAPLYATATVLLLLIAFTAIGLARSPWPSSAPRRSAAWRCTL